jgi:uncharacterized protein
MDEKIWVKTFTHKDKFYCYDVSTNNIMQITKLLFEMLKVYDYSNEAAVIGKLNETYSLKEISETITIIHKFNKEKGGFGLKRDIPLKFSFSMEEYQRALKNLVNHMILNITEGCNFRCKYCKYSGIYSFSRKHGTRSMSMDTIKKAIDFFIANASYIINDTNRDLVLGFYGGEPLLEHKKIFEAIEYIETCYKGIFPRFRFSMTTNGSLLTQEIIEKLTKYSFSLLISLDGPQEIHDRYRIFSNGQSTYNLIIEKLDLLKKLNQAYCKERLGFSIVISPEFHLKEVIDYFREHFTDSNRVCLFSTVDFNDTNFFDTFDMQSEWEKFKKDNLALKEEYIDNKLAGKDDIILDNMFEKNISTIHKRRLIPIPTEFFPNGICLPGLQKIFVDPGGYFHFCEKIGWQFNIGNLDTGFNNGKIFSLIDKYIETTGHCKHCWAVRFCEECFLSSIKGNDFSSEHKKKSCKAKQARVLENIIDFITIMEGNPRAFDFQNKKKQEEVSIETEVFKFLHGV